jgi:hypothetical protein
MILEMERADDKSHIASDWVKLCNMLKASWMEWFARGYNRCIYGLQLFGTQMHLDGDDDLGGGGGADVMMCTGTKLRLLEFTLYFKDRFVVREEEFVVPARIQSMQDINDFLSICQVMLTLQFQFADFADQFVGTVTCGQLARP